MQSCSCLRTKTIICHCKHFVLANVMLANCWVFVLFFPFLKLLTFRSKSFIDHNHINNIVRHLQRREFIILSWIYLSIFIQLMLLLWNLELDSIISCKRSSTLCCSSVVFILSQYMKFTISLTHRMILHFYIWWHSQNLNVSQLMTESCSHFPFSLT